MILARHELIASFFTRNYTLTIISGISSTARSRWLNNRCGRREKEARGRPHKRTSTSTSSSHRSPYLYSQLFIATDLPIDGATTIRREPLQTASTARRRRRRARSDGTALVRPRHGCLLYGARRKRRRELWGFATITAFPDESLCSTRAAPAPATAATREKCAALGVVLVGCRRRRKRQGRE